MLSSKGSFLPIMTDGKERNNDIKNKGNMAYLPEDFISYTTQLLGNERFLQLSKALEKEPEVSVRLNPFKINPDKATIINENGRVAWCDHAWYLQQRPNFTFDPLLHAGVYYVQEASSMFLHQVLKQYVHNPIAMLDLCAAPGGKTTTARAALPQGSILFSNEPMRQRAQILAENMQKFGHPEVIVTNNFPKDYAKSGLLFDVILSDVPCSGEGMFRKDEGARDEWSLTNVDKCRQLQREIVADIWDNLKAGGLLVYSTCTFNDKENEQNVEWIAQELGADILPVMVEEAWNICPAINHAFPAYRFMPGTTRGEGLFMAVLRKHENGEERAKKVNKKKDRGKQEKSQVVIPKQWIDNQQDYTYYIYKEQVNAFPTRHAEQYETAQQTLKVIHAGITLGTIKGKDIIPDQSLALSIDLNRQAFPSVDIDAGQALAFLRKESITLPTDTPKGFVLLIHRNTPLGLVKNIGNRANNLYPQEWRIKSTHTPEQNNIVIAL